MRYNSAIDILSNYFELVNKAAATLLGVMVLLALHVIDEQTAVEFIDFETLMLLLGMMRIVVILRKSGFFTIVSVKIAELTFRTCRHRLRSGLFQRPSSFSQLFWWSLIKGVAVDEKDKEILFKLCRDHEDVLGSSRIAMLALQAFINSIQALKCDATELRDLFTELCEAIRNTEPIIVPLIHPIKPSEAEMQTPYSDDLEKTKKEAIGILTARPDLLKSKVGRIIEHGVGLIKDGDSIIVHTASSDGIKMLAMTREVFQKNFKVIIYTHKDGG